MSSDQAAKVAATLEVLTGAVGFLLAERVAARPAAIRDDLLTGLQGALSQVPGDPRDPPPGSARMEADRNHWIPIVAAKMIDEVRRQIGLLGRPAVRCGRRHASEVAEGPGREHALGAIAHFEARRAVA
ncbi:hypothetical protein ACRBEV_01505 [Methylobacterium phyllosphaerae]